MNTHEKYARAISSSNLSVEPYVCDVDILIAAGWVTENMSTEIYRLRVEVERCDKHALAAAHYSLIDWLLVRAHMRSLPKAADYMARHARKLALRDYPSVAEFSEEIASAVLGHMMMPTCDSCQGREYEKQPGSPSLSSRRCKACNGTGTKRLKIGKGDDRINFAKALQADVERKLMHLFDMMAKYNANHMGDLLGAASETKNQRIRSRCTAILAKHPHDSAAQKALAALDAEEKANTA